MPAFMHSVANLQTSCNQCIDSLVLICYTEIIHMEHNFTDLPPAITSVRQKTAVSPAVPPTKFSDVVFRYLESHPILVVVGVIVSCLLCVAVVSFFIIRQTLAQNEKVNRITASVQKQNATVAQTSATSGSEKLTRVAAPANVQPSLSTSSVGAQEVADAADTQPPYSSVLSPAEGGAITEMTQGRVCLIMAPSSDDVSRAEDILLWYGFDGATPERAMTSSFVCADTLANGSHTMTYYAEDKAGNVESSKIHTFIVALPAQ